MATSFHRYRLLAAVSSLCLPHLLSCAQRSAPAADDENDLLDDASNADQSVADDDDEGGDDDDDDDDPGESTELDPKIKFDLAESDTLGDLDPESVGCQAIDFLFVVDNSGSMADEQTNLTDSFPGFMAGIHETLQAKDFHVMIVDSDAATPSSSSDCTNSQCTCSPAPDCCVDLCESGQATVCNDRPCDDLGDGLACDGEIGAGRVNDENGQSCDLADNRRYMLQTQPMLDETFACVAKVGTMGDGKERVMQAISQAVSAPLNTKDGCNEGFLRDDSVLVVVFVTDEEEKGEDNEDGGSPGDPQDWYDTLRAIKGDVDQAIVMVGFYGDTGKSNAICQPLDANNGTGAEASPRIDTFMNLWGDYGLAASVCEKDYGPAFAQAIAVIDGACDNFPPK